MGLMMVHNFFYYLHNEIVYYIYYLYINHVKNIFYVMN